MLGVVEEVAHRDEQGRVAQEPQLAVVVQRGEPTPGLLPVLGPRLAQRLAEVVHDARRDRPVPPFDDLVAAELHVPQVEVAQVGERAESLAVPARRGERDPLALLAGHAAVASRDLEARDEPLEVPLEGAAVRLVEVVDVEDQRALGGCEPAEVREVRVAAELDGQVRARPGAEVGRHDRGRPPVEREGGGGHASHAERDERRDPARVLGLEDRDGVATVGRRRPRGGRATGEERACRASLLLAVLGRGRPAQRCVVGVLVRGLGHRRSSGPWA
nr:hypothetical protein [Oerskovia enterophila]